MKRIYLMWVIMVFSAITGMAQYGLLGVMYSNHNPLSIFDNFNEWFWYVEWGLWAIRSVVEAVCVGYMFMTVATRWQDKLALSVFETIILLVIAFTIGIMTMGVSQGIAVSKVLNGSFHPAWSFAIGAISPLMMAGAGIAYRVQPVDANQVIVNAAAIKETEELRTLVTDLQQHNEELRVSNEHGAMWAVMSDIGKARVYEVVKQFANGNGPALETAYKNEIPATTRSRAKVK